MAEALGDVACGASAMVLAAGLGKRMHPLTLTTPKPLIEVAGKKLIEYAFEHLRAASVKRAVVNVHYLAGQIEKWAHAQNSPEIIISDERGELLDTGGGICKVLYLLGPNPFLVLNSDSFWIDGARPAIDRLRDRWDSSRMDSLLLLCPLQSAVGYDGKGDFSLDADGGLVRREGDAPAPFVYTGCCLVAPGMFEESPRGAFSINLLWDRAKSRGRLFGLAHDGAWIHVGRPESIAYAEKVMRSHR